MLMVKAWVHDIAVRDVSLRGKELSSALAYAERDKVGLLTVPDKRGRLSLVQARALRDFALFEKLGPVLAILANL